MRWPATRGLPLHAAIGAAMESDLGVGAALGGWRAGVPRHELALLNRLTEQLCRVRCSSLTMLGFSVVNPSVRVYELHGAAGAAPSERLGADAFGADFAVTVELRPYLKKTAFLQLKRFDGSGPNLEKEQLRDAQIHADVWERSYVAAARTDAGPAWVRATKNILANFPAGQDTAMFHAPSADWWPSIHWTAAWLSCETGPPSDFDDPAGVEARLTRFVELSGEGDGEPPDGLAQRFPEFARLRGWYHMQGYLEGL